MADDFAEFENYASPPAWFGPTGVGNFTTPAGQSLPSGKTGRYAMVRATLTGNGTDSPTLSDIQLTCNSASDTGSRVIRTAYDDAGNILKITTIDDLGVSEDVRDDAGWSPGDRINTLNQVLRQDVGGDTWTFSWDLNGNMTGKTNGLDTWIYTWNDENRLVRVQGPGSVDVAYSYDRGGRMLTRDDGANVTTFAWDGFDCIREQTGMTSTSYCIPQRMLFSFVRDNVRYDLHVDALGSVRMVTNDTGAVVARFEYDAWGEPLASSFDNVPGGMPYRFTGSWGCRADLATSLVYMRQRWYSPQIQSFLSRDVLMGTDRYMYGRSNPVKYIDRNGKQPEAPVPLPNVTPTDPKLDQHDYPQYHQEDHNVRDYKGGAVPHPYRGNFEHSGAKLLDLLERGSYENCCKDHPELIQVQSLKQGAPRWRNCFSFMAQKAGLLRCDCENFWINAQDVTDLIKQAKDDNMLTDTTKENLLPGDLVLYEDDTGLQHGAIVTGGQGADATITSDWGDMGVYSGGLESVPTGYGRPTQFYRPSTP